MKRIQTILLFLMSFRSTSNFHFQSFSSFRWNLDFLEELILFEDRPELNEYKHETQKIIPMPGIEQMNRKKENPNFVKIERF